MYKDTVTLFNRYTDATGALYWRPVVFLLSDFNADRAAILAQYGENSADRSKWHIRVKAGANGAILAGTKRYLLPHAYTGAPGTFTLRSGNDFDFFALGDYSGADIADGDYLDGFYNEFNATHDNVFVVSNVALYSVIPHIEVTGK